MTRETLHWMDEMKLSEESTRSKQEGEPQHSSMVASRSVLERKFRDKPRMKTMFRWARVHMRESENLTR